MEGFKKLYLNAMYAKFYMGIYFVALVVLVGVMQYMYGNESVRVIALLQMLGVSVVLALLQTLLLDEHVDYGKGVLKVRTLLWLVLSDVIIIVSAWLGGWLVGLPVAALGVLGILMFMGLGAMFVGQKWEQDTETVKLNQNLKDYQSGNSKE